MAARPIGRGNVDAWDLSWEPRGGGIDPGPETGEGAVVALTSSPSLCGSLGESDGRTGPATIHPSHRSLPLVEAAVLSIPKHEHHHPCKLQLTGAVLRRCHSIFHGGIITHPKKRTVIK